jgi:LEA14-like dessication related protein
MTLRAMGLLAAFAVSGCASLQGALSSAVKTPELTFESVELKDASLADATVELVFGLHNPNPVGLSLAEVDYAFAVEGKQVASGKPDAGLQIPAQGTTQLRFPAKVAFAELAQAAIAAASKESVAYRASGGLGVQSPVGVLRVPLAKEGNFSLPKPPSVEVEGVQIKSLSAKAASLEVGLRVGNQNSFPLSLGRLSGALRIDGAEVGKVSLEDVGTLSEKGARSVSVPLSLGLTELVRAAPALRRGSGAVAFTGQLSSKGVTAPLRFQKAVEFGSQRQ